MHHLRSDHHRLTVSGCLKLNPPSFEITEFDLRGITEFDLRGITEFDLRGITESDLRGITESDLRGITESDLRRITEYELRRISKKTHLQDCGTPLVRYRRTRRATSLLLSSLNNAWQVGRIFF